MRHLARQVVVLTVLFLMPAVSAMSAEVRTLKAGESIALASGTAEIKNTTKEPRGKVAVSTTAGDSKTYTLLYTAPSTATVFTETITYTDPTERAVSVTVTPGDDVLYGESFKSLFVLFVVALLLESALALIFNWRPFLVYFDGRGVKTLISLAVAWLFVENFNLDIVTRLVNVYSQVNPPYAFHPAGRFVTAMILAGGSAVVNSVLIGLGFRSVKTVEQVVPKPPATVGWISACVNRDQSIGPVDVFIGNPTPGPPVAGTITGKRRRSNFARLFVRDTSRYPMSGGFVVAAGSSCMVKVQGRDANGASVTKTWGPEAIAPGAIIDLEFTL